MGSLFSTPKVSKPAAMPDVNDPAIKAAENRTRQQAMNRSGRDSTILTNPGTGGSQAYKNSLLGQS
jgi:hypothetical protein